MYKRQLLFCEMYAGGKYGEGEDNYEVSLGLNGLGLCATQYASAWMTADIYRDGFHYHLDFKKGENVGGLQKEPYKGRRTGRIIINELNDVAKKYAQPRRSEILYDLPEEESGAEEESIPDYPVTCLLYTSDADIEEQKWQNEQQKKRPSLSARSWATALRS